jgi:hypothetical protein
MPSYNVSVPHELGQDDALARLRRFLDDVQRDYAAHVRDVRGEWIENRLQFGFVATGLPISGTLVVEETIVHVAGPLPLAAALFRGRIEQTIRDQLQRLLGD